MYRHIYQYGRHGFGSPSHENTWHLELSNFYTQSPYCTEWDFRKIWAWMLTIHTKLIFKKKRDASLLMYLVIPFFIWMGNCKDIFSFFDKKKSPFIVKVEIQETTLHLPICIKTKSCWRHYSGFCVSLSSPSGWSTESSAGQASVHSRPQALQRPHQTQGETHRTG